jgi:hypothetical protein
LCDVSLYAWKLARGYAFRPKDEPSDAEKLRRAEKAMEEAIERQAMGRAEPWWEVA